jgi:hypothetical protein
MKLVEFRNRPDPEKVGGSYLSGYPRRIREKL